AEALDMLQAMNTGHDGSMTTLHANKPRDALARIETLVLMAGYDLPVRAIRAQITSAINVIVHLERLRDGTRKVGQISEVTGAEGRRPALCRAPSRGSSQAERPPPPADVGRLSYCPGFRQGRAFTRLKRTSDSEEVTRAPQ